MFPCPHTQDITQTLIHTRPLYIPALREVGNTLTPYIIPTLREVGNTPTPYITPAQRERWVTPSLPVQYQLKER